MHPTRRLLPLLALAGAVLVPFAVTLAACGGNEPPPAPPPMPSATAPVAPSTASAAPQASAAPTDTASAAPIPPPPPPVPTSIVATRKADATFAPCHQSYKATNKDVSKDVAAMAKGCEKVTKMKLYGKTFTGSQADQDKPQTFSFDAKANHCYRAYAQAADGIKDLDVVMKDSANIVVGEDTTDDPSPVVNEDGAVCFTKDDKATVVVSVGMGKGSYAVQIWGD